MRARAGAAAARAPAHGRARHPRHRGGGAARRPRGRAVASARRASATRSRSTLPRPRDPTHPGVVEAVHAILTELGLERDAERDAAAGARHGASIDDAFAESSAGSARRRRSCWRCSACSGCKPWQRIRAAARARGDRRARRETLAVGFLPVTCHLTCPVTDFASKTSRRDALRVAALHRLSRPSSRRSRAGGSTRRS